MAVPLEQFVKHLEKSGILAGDTLKDFIPPKASPKDAEELLRELIRQKKLTKFQAEAFIQGNGKSLVLDNYVLLEKIGEGGMGQVFKAEHRRLHRIVAVKVLPTNMMKNAATVARFQREVQAAARINHPNIVTAFDAGQDGGVHFLVMEYVEGSDLSAMVKRNGPFPVEQAVNCILQTARGLEAAHANGIVHRDIKPANLLVNKEGTVKILDMGLARLSAHGDPGQQAELTNTGAVMGTVDYMAPEQALDTKTADARADIYSLGCTLFYLLTGKATYDGDSLMAKLLAHRDRPIPSLRAVRPDVSDLLEAVFRKMVAKTVDNRYQTMTEVISDLDSCASGREPAISPVRSLAAFTEEGLTSFLQGVSRAAPRSVLPEKSAAPSFGRSKSQFLRIGGGVVGVGVLLAGLVTIFITRDRKLAEPQAETLGTAKRAPAKDEPESAELPIAQKTLNDPAFRKWMRSVAALPAEKQVEAVARKLQELNPGILNPGFDGKVESGIENGAVNSVGFLTDNDVTDISPVRALPALQRLACTGTAEGWLAGRGKLSDLSPLAGMKLTLLDISRTRVSDLSPLKGMPLTTLACVQTQVADLAPLKGMKLTGLGVDATQVSDLSVLRGMPLTHLSLFFAPVANLSALKGMKLISLSIRGSQVSDLSPLEGMPLENLDAAQTPVSDLLPLRGMPLTVFHVAGTQVFDLSPIRSLPLSFLNLDFEPERDTELLRSIKTLETINNKPLAEFWKEVEEKQKGKKP